MSKLQHFLGELQRRRVLRVALAYGAAAFAAVQAADVYFPALGLPGWAFRLVALLSLLGFPVVVVLAWLFDISADGVRRTAAAEATPAASLPAASGGTMARAAAALVALVLLFVAGAFVAFRTGAGSSEAPSYTHALLTAEPGVEWFPSVSPDGEWFVYSGVGPGGDRDIFLRAVGGQNPINLTADSPADDDQPAFSPDGERIAFRSERDGGGIFVMQRTGEGTRRVTRSGYRPSWSPDGRKLAFATENVELHPQNMDHRSELWIADVASGALRHLTSVDDAVVPAWSPHGQRIAFFRRRVDAAGDWGIWTVDSAGGSPQRVTAGARRGWSPAWSPDGRYLYYASDRAGSMNLWRVQIDEESGEVLGEPEPITTPATSLAHISVSGDGRVVLYGNVLVTINVQAMPVDPASARPTGEPVWITTGTRRWSSPDPSPDGSRVAMYSLTQPEGHLYVMDADGSGVRQVTGDSTVDRVPRWSPDGEWLAFFSSRNGALQLWKIRADGSELQQLTERGTTAVWSPDGTRIATGALGRTTVIIDPQRRWTEQRPDTLPPIHNGETFSPNDWSPDGARLAGSDGFSDSGIIIYDVATQRYDRLTDFGQWPVWLDAGRTLLFVSGGNAFYTVDRITRKVERVYEVQRDVIGPPRLASDRRTVYFTRRVTESDVWMVKFE